jgi:hypothetical protein
MAVKLGFAAVLPQSFVTRQCATGASFWCGFLLGLKQAMAIRDLRAAQLNAQALRLRRLGLSYIEVARIMGGGISPSRARLRALEGLRAEALRQGKHYYHLKHDTYLNWR